MNESSYHQKGTIYTTAVVFPFDESQVEKFKICVGSDGTLHIEENQEFSFRFNPVCYLDVDLIGFICVRVCMVHYLSSGFVDVIVGLHVELICLNVDVYSSF